MEKVQLVPTNPPAKVRRREDGRMAEGKVSVRDWGRPWVRRREKGGGELDHCERRASFDERVKATRRRKLTFAEAQQVSLDPSVRYFLPTDLSRVEETLREKEEREVSLG